jgi:hypothetical protein
MGISRGFRRLSVLAGLIGFAALLFLGLGPVVGGCGFTGLVGRHARRINKGKRKWVNCSLSYVVSK